MKKILFPLFVLVLLFVSACGAINEPIGSQASATPAATQAAAPAAETPAVADTASTTDGAACISDDSVTNFSPRGPLVMNGAETGLQVRDAQCPRAIFHDETGIYDPNVAHSGEGNWTVNADKGWVVAFAATSCYVQPAGQPGVSYTDTPFILIYGPWDGYVGCFEAGVHGTVTEWEDFLTGVILPIHESEVGHSVTPIIIGNRP